MGDQLSVYERWKAKGDARPRPMTPVELMAMASEMLLHGADSMQVAKKLSIPYPEALNLCREIRGEVLSQIRSRYTPEVQAALKDELSDTLVEEVAVCRVKARKNLRAYSPLNTAAKKLSEMHGLNAPTRSVNIEWKAHALANPDIQQRIMSDPEARAAFLLVEEFANRGRLAIDPDDGGGR